MVLSVVLVEFFFVLWVEIKNLDMVRFFLNDDWIGILIVFFLGLFISFFILINCVKLEMLLWVLELFIIKMLLFLLNFFIILDWILFLIFVYLLIISLWCFEFVSNLFLNYFLILLIFFLVVLIIFFFLENMLMFV